MRTVVHVDELRLEECARQGGLNSARFLDIRRHLAGCETCRVRMEEMCDYVSFMREHPEETAGRLVIKRETASGTMFLVVEGSDATDWEGRVIGAGHDFARRFASGPEALAALERWFDEAVVAPAIAAIELEAVPVR